jgi:hypothetical protein
MSITPIPSLGFARGAVVRAKGGGPNMLVVRGLGETTAVVLCEGNGPRTLRLQEFKTGDLEQVMETQQHKPMSVKPVWQAPPPGSAA